MFPPIKFHVETHLNRPSELPVTGNSQVFMEKSGHYLASN